MVLSVGTFDFSGYGRRDVWKLYEGRGIGRDALDKVLVYVVG